MDRKLMRRPPWERARDFRAFAKEARHEASLAPTALQTSLLNIADEWDYLAREAEAEANRTV